jgi:hypothetical protein
MKTSPLILLILFVINVQAQKGIKLTYKENQKTTFLAENRRIKVFTINGKSKAGKFRILDENTIIIKNDTLALDSLVKIRRASTFSAIASPIAIYFGGSAIIGAVAGAAAGGYGLLATIVLLPPGLPLFIIPLTANKHNRNKWKYEILN